MARQQHRGWGVRRLRGIKAVILVGGGTVLTEQWLRKWYGDKILTPKKFESTKKIHPVDMNAVGDLRFAMMRQKQMP